MLFAREIEALDTASGAAATRPAMELPSDAKWGDLRFAFVSDEVLHVSYKGQPAKRIEPDQLGMKSEKSGKATRQWRLLRMNVNATVTNHTTHLVVGDQDHSVLAGHTKSSKHRKAEQMCDAGHQIRIMSEAEFRRFLSDVGLA